MDPIETPFPPFEPQGEKSGRPDAERTRRKLPMRYVWPNLVTVLAICAGMTGVRMAFEGKFETAVFLVLLAAFLDGIDGRLARMLKAASPFGANLDSLADVVNFGVAPALVSYVYLLHNAKGIGWIIALLFIIACSLRLARFNVALDDKTQPKWQSAYFVGVPAPAGAGLVLLPVYLGVLGVEHEGWFAYMAAFYTLLIALLMVSRLPVFSGKRISSSISREWAIPLLLVIVFYLLVLGSFPWQTLSLSAVIFLASIPVSVQRYRKQIAAAKSEDSQ